MPSDEEIACPHCGTSIYPQWKATSFAALNPQRSREQNQGVVHATTCTSASCNKPILEFEPNKGAALGDMECVQVFPVPDLVAIEIVIQIVLDFENIQRREQGKEDLSDKEREAKASKLREKLRSAKEAIMKDIVRRATAGLSVIADIGQVTELLK